MEALANVTLIGAGVCMVLCVLGFFIGAEEGAFVLFFIAVGLLLVSLIGLMASGEEINCTYNAALKMCVPNE